MLALSACIFGSDLIAINALDGETLRSPLAWFLLESPAGSTTYFVLFLRTELNKSCVYIVKRWGRESRAWRRLRSLLWLRRYQRSLLYGSSCGWPSVRALRWQLRPACHVLQRSCLHRCTKTIGHRTSRWVHGRCPVDAIWSSWPSISGTRLRSWGIRVVCEARALEKVLLLARGILCSDLMTVDTLHGETLVVFCKQVSVDDEQQVTVLAERRVGERGYLLRGTRQTPHGRLDRLYGP